MISRFSLLGTSQSALRPDIGAARFELATSCSQSRRSTKLSYAPCSNEDSQTSRVSAECKQKEFVGFRAKRLKIFAQVF
jgi:hypothetical protein